MLSKKSIKRTQKFIKAQDIVYKEDWRKGMIFYFTGTGNSLFAAKKLLDEGERLVNIAEAAKNNEYEYRLDEAERLGIVFPVYFYTVSTFVADFVNKLTIENVSYTYSVVTCGGSISQTGAVLKKLLQKRNIELNYVTPLLMPDNAMLFYNIPSAEEGKDRIDNAIVRLAEIKRDVAEKKQVKIGDSTINSTLIGQMYKACQGTKKYWVEEDKCNGCGLCEKNCPESVIKLENGKPAWKKDKCCKCSSCINRCPKAAIQYGRLTKNRNRYKMPENQSK